MNMTAAEARAIAKEAYIYGFPMVDNMRVQYAYFTDKKDPDYKAPYNITIHLISYSLWLSLPGDCGRSPLRQA